MAWLKSRNFCGIIQIYSCQQIFNDFYYCNFILAIVVTEVLICVKFGWNTITKPLPRSIALWWLAFGLGLFIYTVVKFVIFKPTKLAKPEEDKIIHGSPTRKPNIENDENESKKEL